jgi:hypothetical protein
MTASFKYDDGTLVEFEVRGRYTNQEGSKGQEVGNIFYGSDGWLEIYGDSWNAFRGRDKAPFASSKELQKDQTPNHYANFVEAIREGKDDMLHCDILDGFMSSSLPHLANISYRTGRLLKFMGDYEKFADDPEADKLLARVYRKPYVVPETI